MSKSATDMLSLRSITTEESRNIVKHCRGRPLRHEASRTHLGALYCCCGSTLAAAADATAAGDMRSWRSACWDAGVCSDKDGAPLCEAGAPSGAPEEAQGRGIDWKAFVCWENSPNSHLEHAKTTANG